MQLLLPQSISNMMTRRAVTTLPKLIKRNYGLTAPVLQKATDPIQQLFIDKIREYKSKSAGGKLVDASPQIQQAIKTETEKIIKQYKADTQDMTAFPKFSFPEPKVDMCETRPKEAA